MIIYVKVKPCALCDKVERLSDGSYLVYTRERAIDGKANLSVIKMIAHEFGVSFNRVLIKNPRSRKKIVEIKIKP